MALPLMASVTVPDPGSVTSVTVTSVASSPLPHSDQVTLIKKTGVTSWAHSHFHVHATDAYMANCDLCKKDVKCGDKKWGLSTSCLTSHLRNKHRDVYDKAVASQAQAVSDAADAAAKLPKQKTLSSFFGVTKELKETALLKFIIDCGLPKGLVLTVRTVPASTY